MGFPREETNCIFWGVFKSRFKRKVIKNVKEYEQGNWIHTQAASLFCLQPSCADRPSLLQISRERYRKCAALPI